MKSLPFEVKGKRGQEDGGDDLPVEDEHEVVHALIKRDLREQEHPGVYRLDQHDDEVRLLSRVHDRSPQSVNLLAYSRTSDLNL